MQALVRIETCWKLSATTTIHLRSILQTEASRVMKDMTRGSIVRHLVGLAIPIAIGMMFQMLYVMVDLYFVAGLGDAAIAGLVTAGNIQFIVLALTQVLGTGAMALIAQAVGRGDRADATLVFNQSLLIACLCAGVTLAIGYGGADLYMRSVAADEATRAAGTTYLHWFLPGMALQFALVAMGSALRGTGVARPGMIVQMATVALNALLAPVLVAGWLTHRPMGIAGAGLASSISIALGVALMTLYFARREKYIRYDAMSCRPDPMAWKRILRIGLPPGGEFVMLFVFLAVIYAVIRPFGAAAQAGFGIGSRLNQAIFLPAMAVAFAVAPLAGQNFGAHQLDRVRDTFRAAAIIGSSIMQELRYEGYGPSGVALIIDAMTDNPVRTVADVRHALSKHGGNLGTSGSVAFQFKHVGELVFDTSAAGSEDKLLEVALDAGADDVVSDGGRSTVLCAPDSFEDVKKALTGAGLAPLEADIVMALVPTSGFTVSAHQCLVVAGGTGYSFGAQVKPNTVISFGMTCSAFATSDCSSKPIGSASAIIAGPPDQNGWVQLRTESPFELPVATQSVSCAVIGNLQPPTKAQQPDGTSTAIWADNVFFAIGTTPVMLQAFQIE